MILVTLLVVLGLLVGAWAATARSYRLSGVVVVSLLAVYTLLSVWALPVFLLSTALAYVGLAVVQGRWLFYGRRLLLTAVLLGAVLPVATVLAVTAVVGRGIPDSGFLFYGSILPGIAAYNFHRQDADRRLVDAAATAALYLGLVVVGVVAVVLWATPPCTTCGLLPRPPATYVTPVLLDAGSDVANILGLRTTPAEPPVGTLALVSVVVGLGLALTELVRFRWGLRSVGVVAIPLVVLFSFRTWWVLPLYLGTVAVVYAGVQVVHHRTLLYGRALLSLGSVLGVLVALPVAIALDLTGGASGLATVFVGLLGGVGGYAVHATARRERVAMLVLSGGIFVVAFAAARLLVTPLPDGLGTPLTGWHLAAGVAVLAAAVWQAYDLERFRPSQRRLLDASPFTQEVTGR